MTLQIILIVLTTRVVIGGLTGYDCKGEGLNITTLSLLDIGTCNLEDLEPDQTEAYIQLMQVSDFDKTSVIQCQVEIDRMVFYCGMHSHVSIVNNGRKQYTQEMGADACQRLHETGSMRLSSTIIDRITGNSTNRRSVMLAGRVTGDGSCHGAQYSDGYGSWDNVIVQATVKVTLRTFEASIKRSTDEIILPSGNRCRRTARTCQDSDGAETYWTPGTTDSCHFDRYDILYEGIANKLSPKANQTSSIIYTITTRDTTFALTKTDEFSLCGYRLFRTEHPKLIILETQRGRTFKTRSQISVDNLDIFSYVNSKFVYVEKHIKTQLTQLYRDIMEQKCALERQILKNALSLSSIAPDEMAYRIMKAPGYTAVTTGEVIHLIKCVPTECRIRHTEECFNELPVSYRNESYFLLPRSRILTKKGTSRECNDLLPVMYKMHGTWFRVSGRPIEVLPPPTIQPLTKPTWRYVSPDSLATSGIYTMDDLNRLKNHIMFPVERPAALNTIARGAMGEEIPPGSVSMLNLLDEQSLNKIAENTGQRLWQGFVTFGSASAGVLAIFVIIRVVKLVVDTIIHGYTLHSIYGWSLHLLGALWSSVTSLLLHLGRPTSTEKTPPRQDYAALHLEPATEKSSDDSPGTARPATASAPSQCTIECGHRKDAEGRSYGELRKYLNN